MAHVSMINMAIFLKQQSYLYIIFVLLENICRQTATRIHDQNLNTR